MTSAPERAHVERLRGIVARRFGLQFDESRIDQLAELLRDVALANHQASLDAYLERLASLPSGAPEVRAVIERLTVNETFFFRNADSFRALAEHVVPERVRVRGSGGGSLRVLSAGCASGEEPYSIAITLRQSLPELERWQVKIVGVDVNPTMLEKAARARYGAWALRETPEDVRRRYFRPDGRDFELDPLVQAMVTFEKRNLVDADASLWPPDHWDVIFCRNVIMYLTPEVMQDVVRRAHRSLVPGGFLFLGHAETLRGLSQGFHLCHTHDTFYYQRQDGAAARAVERQGSSRPEDVAIAAALPATPDDASDDAASWVDVITRASERVAALARAPSFGGDDVTAAAPATPSPPARSRHLGLALEAMRQERFADALALLSASPPESEGEPDALLLRAALLTNAGDLGEAEHTCRRLLALDELNAGAHYLMALCREHAGDRAGAIEHDQTAVYLDAAFAMPHLHLGLMAKRAGDRSAASQELDRAVALLAREEPSRLLLFGGGFSREALLVLARTELGVLRGGR
ncbi:MAG: hypothetical protein A2138_13305 [Deltaproteobacteria bacterium RBG_16_71_12]|nr:MAG: hypothetical protein A2138_13305 [Deltaproteobacteria bacterium RBG_16_71_12]